MKWIMLKRYCDLSGDTVNAVKKRRQKGIWKDGHHSKIGPNGKIWVNIEAVNRWVEQHTHDPN